MISRRNTFLGLSAIALAGCNSNPSIGSMAGAAVDIGSALTLTDEQVRTYSAQMAKKTDAESTIAPASSRYAQRLAALTSNAREDGGIPLNYKVYMAKDVNAFAMADGTIRIYSALMDMMTDDEVRYVIGHEVGHVVSGHSRKRMQTALATGGLQKAAAASGNKAVATLADSQLGELFTQAIRAQHSQSNEKEADDYSMQFMSRRKFDRKAGVTALEKLAALTGNRGTEWMSTHPAPKDRAARLRTQLG